MSLIIRSKPVSVISWGNNRIDLFGTSGTTPSTGWTNENYHKWWDGIQWHPPRLDWESLDGGIVIV